MKKLNITASIFNPVLDSVGRLTKRQRLLIGIGIFVVLVGSFVYFLYYPKLEQIKNLTKELNQLEKKLVSSKKKAAQINVYKAKMAAAEAKFQLALKALPEEKEIPSLLTNISRAGQSSGLEFLLWQQQNDVPKEFYAEIPVAIQVDGNYHNIATFFAKVAQLSRIVNIKNIRITSKKGGLKLRTKCTAVTYRFVDKVEKKETKKKKKKK